MSHNDDMPKSIEVVVYNNTFTVYGRFGSVLRTDQNKKILYCNLKPGAIERDEMEQALETFTNV